MASLNTNREITFKRTMNFFSKASNGKILFDATQSIYNGSLDFEPDFFIVKAITYISNNEQNKDKNPVLTCEFAEQLPCILGTFSAQGSIKQPNTYYRFVSREIDYTDLVFAVLLLDGQGVLSPNTDISKSTWLCTLEFCKWREII